jgi:N-acetylneuraminic acid mutarotase
MQIPSNRLILTLGLFLSLAPVVSAAEPAATDLPDLPQPRASFGAATLGDTVYVYGGHIGKAHSHSKKDQTGSFVSLDLKKPEGWKELPADQALQGLALVSAGGKLYRIGGMHCRNDDPKNADMISVDTVRVFDPAQGEWADYVNLPEGRSSHDAVVVGSKIYVVGGWTLLGESNNKWIENSLVLDTADAEPKWTSLGEQPWVRRALAVSEANGKLYAIGGIDEFGATSKEVNVYDITTGKWSDAPELPGEDFHGFGVSSWGVAGAPIVCGMSGNIYRLNASGEGWDDIGKLEDARFFHRLVPGQNDKLLVIAGAAHQKGHVASIESFAP